MHSLYFWKAWAKPYQLVYLLMLTAFGGSIAFFLVAYAIGEGQVLEWSVLGKMETIQAPLMAIQSGLFELRVNAENFLISEWYGGSPLHVSPIVAYCYLAFLFLAICVLLSVITTLSRFNFAVGILLLGGFLAYLKMELLMFFGENNKLGLILSLVLYFSVSYYFHAIHKNGPFVLRFFSFVGATVLIGIGIAVGASVEKPFLYLASYGMVAPFAVAMVFVLMVSQEVLAGFMYVTTQGNNATSKHSIRHFYSISLIYILGLMALYLKEIRVIDWNIIYLDPLLLLVISAVLGIWGFRKREQAYEGLMKFFPNGALFYLAMGTVCFLFLGYYCAAYNDPIIEAIKDLILYAHLGYAIIFMVYVTVNFFGPLGRNLPVHKILYKPNYMPYFTFRLAGTITIVALVLRANYEVPLFHGISGYYNGLGDLYQATGEDRLAESYYKQGSIYGYKNHRSNYALAWLANERNDDLMAVLHYKDAIQKRPTPHAYVNLSNVYLDENRVFEALFILSDGLKAFPNSAEIRNNIGIVLGRVKEPDSALAMLGSAFDNSDRKATLGTNLLALAAKNRSLVDTDSLVKACLDPTYWASVANSAALYNVKRQHTPNALGAIPDTTLSYVTFSSLYNHTFNQLLSADSVPTHQLLNYASSPSNLPFEEPLKLLAAMGAYHNGHIGEAFQQMGRLASSSQEKAGYYHYIMGVWAIRQQAPRLAVDYFQQAADNGYPEALRSIAIAWAETGKPAQGQLAWLGYIHANDSIATEEASQMMGLYSIVNPDSALALPKEQAYYYWRYVADKTDDYINDAFLAQIGTGPYYTAMLVGLINHHIAYGALPKAKRYLGLLTSTGQTRTVQQEIATATYQLAASLSSMKPIDVPISKQGLESEPMAWHQDALKALSEGDSARLWPLAKKLVYQQPFYEPGVLLGAKLLGLQNPIAAYNALLSAIEMNPYAPALLEAYVMQCAALGMGNYATYILERLQGILSPEAYQALYTQYQLKVAEEAQAF